MPTYLCWTHKDLLDEHKKKDISKIITDAHHEITGAPRYFVQVIFRTLESGEHYIAGEEAKPDQVWIRGIIREGRTIDQKTALLNKLVNNVSRVTGSARERVWAYLSDIPGSSVVEFGRILPSPGNEAEWFSNLPPELQEYLAKRS